MKVKNLLEEVKLGKEKYNEEKNKEVILESFDDNIENYKVSKILSLMEKRVVDELNENNAPVVRAIRKSKNKIELLEEKEEMGKISTAYAAMKMDSLTEDRNVLADLIEKKNIQRMVNKDVLAHSVALLEYKIGELSKYCERETNLTELVETFEPLVKKEFTIIKEAMG